MDIFVIVKSGKLGPTDLTWDEKNRGDYCYYPVELPELKNKKKAKKVKHITKRRFSIMLELLKKELEVYEAHKSELIGKSRGKFVLIKDDQIINVFDSEIDAIHRGYGLYGNVPFLVKQIVEIETPQNFTSELLGV